MLTDAAAAAAPVPPVPFGVSGDGRWAEVDADIERVIGSVGAKNATRAKYGQVWGRWETWYGANGWDPLDAPFEAFAALVGTFPSRSVLGGNRSVVPVPPNTVKGWFNALIFHYREAGRVPVFRQPEFAARYDRLREGYARWFAKNRAGGPEKMCPPLLAADVRRLLEVEPEPGCHHKSNSVGFPAALLVAVLSGCRYEQAASVRAGDISDLFDVAGVQVPVGGEVLRVVCEHPQLPGWVSGCPACALRRTREQLADDGSPLVGSGTTLRLRGNALRRAWPVISRERPLYLLRRAGHVDDSVWNGFLTALAWSLDGQGVRSLATKVRFALMWAMGESAGEAAEHFTIRDVRRDGNEYRVTNPHTGLTLDVRPVADGHGDLVYGLHAALTEWMGVLGAAGLTPDDPLFPTWGASGMQLRPVPLRKVQAARFVTRLAEQAGITGRVTSDSTKTGYIAEAGLRGADLLAVAIATRRRSLDDLNALMAEHAASRGQPVRRLIEQRAANQHIDNEDRNT